MFHNLLSKYEFLFDEILVTGETKYVDIELQQDTKPSHAKPYLAPRSDKCIFKMKETGRIFLLGSLK